MPEASANSSFSDTQKRRYFNDLAERYGLKGTPLVLHTIEGVRGDWVNVPLHELRVAGSVEVMSDLLGIGADLKKAGVRAASVHDLSKRKEKGSLKPGESVTWDSYHQVSSWANERLAQAGFTEQEIRLAASMGHESLSDIEEVLNKTNPTEEDTVALIIHAVDDWTTGSKWSTAGAFMERMVKNRTNPSLAQLNEDGFSRFGMSTTDKQQEIGLRVIQKLAQMVTVKSGNDVSGKDLPLYVDEILKKRISAVERPESVVK